MKDPIEIALEMLLDYEEGMPPRKFSLDHRCECEGCNE